ncbi:MAG TPA: PLP-dependent aminotransferase family protein [Thermoanaerobaculia bacterium]|nr:PLP-dependent aminotransferase family protein [Thermoanaerobaculia bacterium]
MAKQTVQLPLTLPPREPGAPASRWLYDQLRAAILEGRLRPGARLPATRDLARHYGLARGTIVEGFEQLKAEGYLEASVGSGTYVARVLPDRLLEVRSARAMPAASPASEPPPARRLSDYARRVRPFEEITAGPLRAFRANRPALDLFPTTLWAQVAARRLRRASASLLLGCGPLGYRPLQEAVAGYLTTSRGVKCVPEQVAIVSGVQEALDLVARLVVNPGDRVAVENPGYIGATLVFEASGATVAPVPVDDEGLSLSHSALRGARLVYVTPAHQFPLGVSMSLPRRLALLAWARASGALLFEDDYDSEYRYSGRPLPALQGLDRHGLVLFAGSFSKVLFSSLRLGYLVVPADLVAGVAATLSITQRHAPLLEQAVLADFITGGHFGRHIRRMREVYAERLAVLLETAAERLAGLLEISQIEAGLQTVGWLPGGIDGETATQAAAERGVEVSPLGRYARGPMARDGLLLGFAAVDPPAIRRGVEELAVALEGVVGGAATSRGAL